MVANRTRMSRRPSASAAAAQFRTRFITQRLPLTVGLPTLDHNSRVIVTEMPVQFNWKLEVPGKFMIIGRAAWGGSLPATWAGRHWHDDNLTGPASSRLTRTYTSEWPQLLPWHLKTAVLVVEISCKNMAELPP